MRIIREAQSLVANCLCSWTKWKPHDHDGAERSKKINRIRNNGGREGIIILTAEAKKYL
jgi:hypothetical protein